MSEELREIIDNNPVWYRDLQYKDVMTFIRDNINNATRSFVAIGYYLKHIRDKEMYVLDGYESIWELAQAEFGISKSQASKFMSINDRFSKGGNSPILLDKYKEFSSSKLSEMLYLTDEQLEQVTPATTIVEIREIREPEEVVSTSKQDPHKKVCKWDGKSNCVAVCNTGADCCNECKEHGHCNGECGWQDERIPKQEPHHEAWFIKQYFDQRQEDLAKLMRICREHKAKGDIAKEFQVYKAKYGYASSSCSDWDYTFRGFAAGVDWRIGKEEIHMKYGRLVEEALKLYDPADQKYDEKKPDDFTKPVNDKPKIVDNKPEIVNDVDETPLQEKECSNCRYNIISRDEYFSKNPDAKEFPCDTCGAFDNWEPEVVGLVLDCFSQEEGWHKEIIIDEPDPVETVEAAIVQTVPENNSSDPRLAPMKMKHAGDCYTCPSCGAVLVAEYYTKQIFWNFCPYCGQAIIRIDAKTSNPDRPEWYRRFHIGLRDANKTYIREGDILTTPFGRQFRVDWDQKEARFIAEAVVKEYKQSDHECYPMYNISDCHITGSVYKEASQ